MKNQYFKSFIIFILGIFTLLLSLNIYANEPTKNSSVFINNKKITLEVADTPETRETGLMFRDNMDENHGMIFLFDKPEVTNFWMKNVKIPLDILFIYKNKIVKLYTMLSGCTNEPCEIYPSEHIVDSVIEVNSGFCYKNKIKAGQKIELDKNLQERIRQIDLRP